MISQYGENPMGKTRFGSAMIPATVVLVDGDEAGQAAIRDITGKTQGKKRLIEEAHCLTITSALDPSLDGWKTGCSVIELRRHLHRLERETKVLSGIGEKLGMSIEYLGRQLEIVEQAGQGQLVNDQWTRWRRALDRIKRNPLEPTNVEAELQGTPSRDESAQESS